MILRCRTHRAGNLHRIDALPFALLFAIFVLAPMRQAMSQGAAEPTAEAGGVTWFPAVPIQITAGVDMGYDDHVTGNSATTTSSGQASVFARENIVLTYARPGQRTAVSLIGVGRFEQFFDLGTDDKNANVTLSLTHSPTTRLSFYTNVYAAYETEPDFISDVGPENVRADHFNTIDIFSVTYQWLPRLSSITNYTFQRVKYADASIGSQADRIENTIGETLQFSLTSRTNLFANYSYDITDYDTAPLNSTTHTLSAGIEHHLTEHLIVRASAGPSLRSLQDDGDSTSPYAEASVNYTSSNHSLTWITSYGFEAPNDGKCIDPPDISNRSPPDV